jgi:CheY-like chemotaxis protein
MPRMNGHEVLQALRANPQTKHIPVILLTSLGSEQKVADSMTLGAACHVEKWADSKVLLGEVKMALQKHRQLHTSKGPDAKPQTGAR